MRTQTLTDYALANTSTPVMTMCAELPSSWFALHVRAKSETLVSSALQRKGFQTFAPTFLARRNYTDRIKKVEAALFPGYVFCRFDPAHALPIVTTPSVYRILCTGTRPASVSNAEVESIRRVADTGLAAPAPYFAAGHRVRIDYGPLAGIEGFVVSLKGVQRLIVNVELLQRSVAVQLDQDHVCPV